jgi:hypothetical protein
MCVPSEAAFEDVEPLVPVHVAATMRRHHRPFVMAAGFIAIVELMPLPGA